MMGEHKLGVTGKFPLGKLGPDDEGELKMAVAHDNEGNVHVNFGTEVVWFALPCDQAIKLAMLILHHAGAKNVAITL
jgi:hypothetical protein